MPSLYCFGDGFEAITRQSSVWQRTLAGKQNSILPLESMKELGLYSAMKGKAAILACCASTFDAIAQLEKQQGFAAWDWVMACYQTQGRGQYGREWQSPLGNLCVSQILPSSLPSGNYQIFLPMLIAVVIVRILNHTGVPVRLKWPNDIILFGSEEVQKVGGLLLEDRRNSLVFGLGLNFATELSLNGQKEALPPGVLPAPDNLIEFWQDCSEQLQIAWQRWQRCSESKLRQEIEDVMAFLGSRVEFLELDRNGEVRCIDGLLHGLGPCGELILETTKGKQSKVRGFLRPGAYFCSNTFSNSQ